MSIQLEKNVPPPPEDHWARKYPLDHMEVGDSFTLPKPEAERARKAAWAYGERVGRKYKSRTEDENVRVWRVK